jgi:ATP-dependent Lhr-like helicase
MDLVYLEPPASSETALAVLPPSVARWFQQRFRQPTLIQRLAWPHLGTGGHLLLSAPTGTGKTLAAFLPILSGLLNPGERGAPKTIACVYVAPLKALGNDVCRNLRRHLAELASFLPSGTVLPRLAIRTGDTPSSQRKRLREEPPDILLTTPESLAVLLSQGSLQSLFATLRWVVVDEVHAFLPTKRGADLALSLERLSVLAEEHSRPVQRIGLSATATPLALAARFLAGVERRCAIAQAGAATPLDLTLVHLEDTSRFLATLVERLLPPLRSTRTTLVFTNSRGLAERLAWALRRRVPDWDEHIAVHHSAVAAERRRQVEACFKHGRLRVVVSSTSLELGIDVGSVDLVVLVHPPGDVVRLLQRVGRAGHGPGRVRRGLVLTATAAELLEAAVTVASGRDEQCEPLQVPPHPLDVLCQQILGMAAAGAWSADEMFALVKRATPYRDLGRRDFDDCLAYLWGRDADGNDWLPARLSGPAENFTILDEQTARLLRRNLGTILAEPALPVVLRRPEEGLTSRAGEEEHEMDTRPRSGAPFVLVGQVDEAFADRLQPGDRFLLDGRCLEFRERSVLEGAEVPQFAGQAALVVEEVLGRPRVPRWGSEGWPLSRELARRLYLLRVRAAEALREGPEALGRLLQGDYNLDRSALATLVGYFQRQECLSEIPSTGELLLEAVATEHGTDYYLHTPLNRLANDALARVAVHRLVRDHGRQATSIVADLGFAVKVRGAVDMPELIRTLLAEEGFDDDLEAALRASLTFRQRFQRVAFTALMLLRHPLGRRRRVGGPNWAERRLFEQVAAREPAFVLLRQALREVREDLCDAAAALSFVQELQRMPLRCRWLPHVSPFVESWTQAAFGPVEVVETPAEALERLHASLMDHEGRDARLD